MIAPCGGFIETALLPDGRDKLGLSRVKRQECRFNELAATSAAATRSSAQEPFAEKRTTEAVFPVVVVDYLLPFKLGDGLF